MQSRHDTTTRKELRAPTILEVHGNKDSRDVIRIGRVLSQFAATLRMFKNGRSIGKIVVFLGVSRNKTDGHASHY
jgi:hypothetical protein